MKAYGVGAFANLARRLKKRDHQHPNSHDAPYGTLPQVEAPGDAIDAQWRCRTVHACIAFDEPAFRALISCCTAFRNKFPFVWILFGGIAVEGPMTRRDKIAFIKSSKRKTHVYSDLNKYTEQQLNDVIREIVQGLIRESEIIANAYINGYR
jgi:hypothetical protein